MSRSVPPFPELLAACQHSAVHLEMRDVYAVDDEAEEFEAWKNGRGRDPDNRAAWWNSFHDVVAAAVARGVTIRRARVVSEPVTEYIRYEHAITFSNVAAGEQVRWLPRDRASDLLLPGNDLWIFDDRLIRFGLFSGDGAFLRHTLEDEPGIVKQCAAAFEPIWHRAIPHDQYTV